MSQGKVYLTGAGPGDIGHRKDEMEAEILKAGWPSKTKSLQFLRANYSVC